MVSMTNGSTGFLVESLQRCLKSLGIDVEINGVFGIDASTAGAVKEFKRRENLDASTGDVDHNLGSILSDRCDALPSGQTGFAGMDRSRYPGDDVMRDIFKNTNIKWTGY